MTTASLRQSLDAGLQYLSEHHDVRVPPQTCDSLLHYVSMLAKWNRVYNLTAVRDQHAMVSRHLLDSLVLLRWLPERSVQGAYQNSGHDLDVMDIGSGAGLPVLPLAIVRPDLVFASVESNGKKTRFQQQAIVELGLSNVQLYNERVQDVSLHARFVTSRAFTAPTEFLSICSSLCSEQGKVALMLAHTDALPDPMPAAFKLEELAPVDIPGSSGPRHVALCRRYP